MERGQTPPVNPQAGSGWIISMKREIKSTLIMAFSSQQLPYIITLIF
jgi:hypothetical protein